MWYYKGHLLEPGDNGIESSGSSLHIKYYNTAKHSGNFSCILSFGELSMRSPDISVKTISEFVAFKLYFQSLRLYL